MGTPFVVGHSPDCLKHDPGRTHTDRPKRLECVLERLEGRDTPIETPPSLRPTATRSVHDEPYIERLRGICDEGKRVDHDTVASPGTWPAALAAAGGAVWAVERAAAAGPGSVAFALTRPPGHHALADRAMGFCFLNNAAIAAEHALDREEIDTVAVLDWDVHYGNGIQHVFAARGDVGYCSIHQRGLYPGTGVVDEIGEGPGRGWTANLQLPATAGGPTYRMAATELVGPLLHAWDPDLLVLSAGFDAHRHDPISDLDLTTAAFGWLAGWTGDLAAELGAPVAAVLEGGYQPGLLAESIDALADAIEGETPPAPEGEPISTAEQALYSADAIWPALD